MKYLGFYFGLLIFFALLAGCQTDGLLEPGNRVTLEELFTAEEAEVLYQDPDIMVRLVGLKFLTNKTALTESSYPILNKFKMVFESFKEEAYTVAVHTDSRGSSSYNLQLSQNRADAIKAYFMRELGVEASLITAIGYGETLPLDTNRTMAGRARNRRVEFIIHSAK